MDWTVLPQRSVQVLTLVPVNVTLFGNKVFFFFAHVMSGNEVTWEWDEPYIQWLTSLWEEEKKHTGKKAMWGWKQRLEWGNLQAKEWQGFPGAIRSQEVVTKYSPIVPSAGSWPSDTLIFRLLSFRAVREYILLFSVTQLVIICYGSSRKMTLPLSMFTSPTCCYLRMWLLSMSIILRQVFAGSSL